MIGENNEWHIQLDCLEDAVVSSPTSCGKKAESSYCDLQDILNNSDADDTVILWQGSAAEQTQCNQTRKFNITVTKSVILKTLQRNNTEDKHCIKGMHGIHFTFNNNCTEHCNITIRDSQFSCSLITFNDLDIRIQNSNFQNSFIMVTSDSRFRATRYNMNIQDAQFNIDLSRQSKNESILTSDYLCRQLNYICLLGQWNFVQILRSYLEGNRQSKVAGVEIMHANIHTLYLTDVQISSMISAMVISSSSSIGIFNITDSILLGNRDGIDVGEGVRYMMVFRSEMNNTGSWLGDWEDDEQCNSALKGNIQILKVESSVFAHNYASGVYCRGAALYIRSEAYWSSPLLSSNNHTLEAENPRIPTTELRNSMFYDNVVDNCSVGRGIENMGGGAVTIYGGQFSLKIAESTFGRNAACKGAGIYIGISKILVGMSKAHFLSTRIIIQSCIFNENVAEYGAGMVTELQATTLNTGAGLYTLISNSLFSKNNVSQIGACISLYFFNVSVRSGVTLKISVFNNTFTLNHAIYGTGMYMHMYSCSFHANSIIELHTSYSMFTSNRETAIYSRKMSCIFYPNSSLTLQISYSIFTSNRANNAAGISWDVNLCSFHLKSVLSFLIYNCSFFSNSARSTGGGIQAWVWSCTFYPNASYILQIADSSFRLNTGSYGAGIQTNFIGSYLLSNSFSTFDVCNSTFMSNEVTFQGAGMYTTVSNSTLYSNSTIIF